MKTSEATFDCRIMFDILTGWRPILESGGPGETMGQVMCNVEAARTLQLGEDDQNLSEKEDKQVFCYVSVCNFKNARLTYEAEAQHPWWGEYLWSKQHCSFPDSHIWHEPICPVKKVQI